MFCARHSAKYWGHSQSSVKRCDPCPHKKLKHCRRERYYNSHIKWLSNSHKKWKWFQRKMRGKWEIKTIRHNIEAGRVSSGQRSSLEGINTSVRTTFSRQGSSICNISNSGEDLILWTTEINVTVSEWSQEW